MFKKIRRKVRRIKKKARNFYAGLKHPKLFSYGMCYFAIPVLLNLIIECMELKSVFKGVAFLFTHPYTFLANTLLIILTLSFTLLLKRRVFWITLVDLIWMIFGIANLVLLCNRVTPFTASDLFEFADVFEVLQKYFNNFQIILLGLLLVSVLAALVMMFFRAPKIKSKINYLYSVIAIVVMIGLGVGSVKLGIKVGFLDAKFAELSAAYRENGFVYCFINSLIDTGVHKPKDYSPEYMAQILKNDNVTITGDKADCTPNIIYIQLETFFDVGELNDVTFSDDVLPNFNKLQEKSGGLFEVPVIGAGTVNTEFEVLTGMNMDDFGAGEYPFKSIMQNTTTESLAYNLRTYGYKVHALHNNTGRFYSRHIVYSNLGFDDFTSVEFMHDYDTTNLGWAKDYCLTNYIMDSMTATEGQDLVYTISVQGHGGYVTDQEYEHHVTITDISEEKEPYKEQLEYYANMLWEMDEFVGQLIHTLQAFDEDVVLVMYGDHLPSLDIQQSELDGRTTHQTDYVIWNNFGLKFPPRDLSADEITSYIMEKLGMNNGIINSYRQNHKDDYDFREGLQALEYDMLYGDHIVYGGKNPYLPSPIKYGRDGAYIENVYPDSSDEDHETYFVTGKNFTKYTKVTVNDEKCTTKYIDDNTVSFTYDGELTTEDKINVIISTLYVSPDYQYGIVPITPVTEEEE